MSSTRPVEDAETQVPRIGICWLADDFIIYWQNSEDAPTPEAIVQFAARHQSVVDELISRGMSPEEFGNDWKNKMGQTDYVTKCAGAHSDAEDGLAVAVLVPPEWKIRCPAEAVAKLIKDAPDVTKEDVISVGWQSKEREVLVVEMRFLDGAMRLMDWVESGNEIGKWEIYTDNMG